MRREMIKHIVKLLRLRRTDASPEWLKKLPEMARRLEDNLYRNAESNEAYRDTKTLKLRLREVAKQMGERKKQQQEIIKEGRGGGS